MKKILFILLIISSGVRGQELIEIGTKHSVYSNNLDEERQYWVYLPPRYNDDMYGKAHYPVLYLLDGEKFFHLLVGIHTSFTRGMYNNMPECIIVGITNTDRTRDLTPSQSSTMHNGIERYKNSGGGSTFNRFLVEELKPLIEGQYRTNGYNLVIGHSFAGLAVLNIMTEYTDIFNAYLAIDPSIWWEDYKYCSIFDNTLQSLKMNNKSLYLAFSSGKDETDSETDKGISTPRLNISKSKGNCFEERFESENHGTVVIPGISNGLRAIFEGTELPVKDIPRNPDLIEKYYKKLSEKTGFQFVPDEIVIDNIGKYALMLGETDNAMKIFQYNLKNYPDSPNAKKRVDHNSKNKQ